MSSETLTDARIAELLKMRKEVVKGSRSHRVKTTHIETDHDLIGADGSRFLLFQRQNQLVSRDFSCGLRWFGRSGEAVNLVRYNGSGHRHRNKRARWDGGIERFSHAYHIHTATESYVRSGFDAEGYAEPTTRYANLQGALQCLIFDCSVFGIEDAAAQGVLPL